MAKDAGAPAYERAPWEAEWVPWHVACQRRPEAELCAAVLDGRLPCLMVVGESRFEPGRGDVDYPTRVGVVPPPDLGADSFIGNTSAPRLYRTDAYGREDKSRPRWARQDGRAWPPHTPFFRFVVSKGALERLLQPLPRSMPPLFKPAAPPNRGGREPNVAPLVERKMRAMLPEKLARMKNEEIESTFGASITVVRKVRNKVLGEHWRARFRPDSNT